MNTTLSLSGTDSAFRLLLAITFLSERLNSMLDVAGAAAITMKNRIFFTVLVLCLAARGCATSAGAAETAGFANRLTATIQEVTAEHNVYEEGRKGLRVYVRFNVLGAKGKNGKAVAYFYDENGRDLKDKNGTYRTSGGAVSTGKTFQPSYENTRYDRLPLFIPYGELHLEGKHIVKYRVVIWVNGQQLSRSGLYSFNLTWNTRSKTPANGSLTCSVDCPKKGFPCTGLQITVVGAGYQSTQTLSSNGTAHFPNLPAGAYSVHLSYPDSKAYDSAASPVPPFSPLSKKVNIQGGMTASVRFE